ncbi:MAG: hypothetical protein KAH20_10295 [Methylococcales bacterium]|nr:hypothetical protein [Methylococcales bacterium]
MICSEDGEPAETSDIQLGYEYNIPVFKTQKQSTSIRHIISHQFKENRKERALESKLAIASGNFFITQCLEIERLHFLP